MLMGVSQPYFGLFAYRWFLQLHSRAGASLRRENTAYSTNELLLSTSFGCARNEKVADFTNEDVYFDLQLS
jgi:hypothetical protein